MYYSGTLPSGPDNRLSMSLLVISTALIQIPEDGDRSPCLSAHLFIMESDLLAWRGKHFRTQIPTDSSSHARELLHTPSPTKMPNLAFPWSRTQTNNAPPVWGIPLPLLTAHPGRQITKTVRPLKVSQEGLRLRHQRCDFGQVT